MNARTQVEPVQIKGKQNVVNQPALMTWFVQSVLRGRWGLQGLATAPQKRLKVVETLTIGPKKQLVLVSCGEQCFLVGTGSDSVQTIVRVEPGTAGIAEPREGKAGEPS